MAKFILAMLTALFFTGILFSSISFPEEIDGTPFELNKSEDRGFYTTGIAGENATISHKEMNDTDWAALRKDTDLKKETTVAIEGKQRAVYYDCAQSNEATTSSCRAEMWIDDNYYSVQLNMPKAGIESTLETTKKMLKFIAEEKETSDNLCCVGIVLILGLIVLVYLVGRPKRLS